MCLSDLKLTPISLSKKNWLQPDWYLPKENFDTSETDKKLQTSWQTEFSPNYRKPTKVLLLFEHKKDYLSRRMIQMPLSPTAWVNGHFFNAKWATGRFPPSLLCELTDSLHAISTLKWQHDNGSFRWNKCGKPIVIDTDGKQRS